MKLCHFVPVLLLSTGLLPLLAQQPELPQTPAGKHAAAYFVALKTGSNEAFLEFFSNHIAKGELQKMSIEQRVQRHKQMYERTGVLKLRQVLESRESFLAILAVTKTGERLRFEFECETKEPFGLLGIGVDQVEAESSGTDRKRDNTELVSAVKEYVAQLTKNDEFSGVVLLAQNGKSLFQSAYGHADMEKKIPNQVDTKFNIGSINKSFTALAIRQLAAKGKLSFGDPIKNFLPDYPNKEAAEKVTVQHLLSMTSGIGDIFGDRYESIPKAKLRTLRDFLPLFADKSLEFEPGADHRYSNGGYVVLGLIIEKVSGVDYYTYVRENIFKPAQMTDTDSYEKDAPVANRASGYTLEGYRKSNDASLPARGSSAGGGYSTALDLLRYTVALDAGTITPPNDNARGGLGIAGGTQGVNACLEWSPKSGYVIVVLSNFDPPIAETIARQIRSWLPGR
jgi:CubicO group peptidase (beta-lactamase class C family)